jgi:5-methylthioadenosine/S-adenosylhomocysteine deaminase
MRWLQEAIWPTEMRHVSAEFAYDGTLLACAEMLRAGVTCFNDMYFFPEASARAALAARMRAALGIIVFEFPSSYGSDAADYLHKGLVARDTFRGEPLLSFCLAPHAPYTVSDASFRQVLTYADELGLAIHMHIHETTDEIRQSLTQYGVRPLERLARLGLLGPSLIAVHAVHLDQPEMDLLAERGCHVAHCPTSNLKLASGIAPIGALLERKVNIGIGTDGAASNNRLDILQELRLAALLAKGAGGKADLLPASEALTMATINGARALGMDALIGSLRPGKAADIIAIDLAALELAPCYDIASHLVYAASREHVTHVWINGEMLMRDRQLRHIEYDELRTKAATWRHRIKPGGAH